MLIAALLELAPGKEWTIQGSRIIWNGSRAGRPTLARINARVAELGAAEPLADLRRERTRRLAESDWLVVRAAETGDPVPGGWTSYRQALRDITESYSSLASVVWPSPPA